MLLYYDLHMHTCLSPCGEEEMTPNNVVNMAMIKGLDILAIADHNHCGNVRSAMAVAAKRDMLLVPAMELQTLEDVHVLCLFRRVEDLEAFFEIVDGAMLKLPNRPERFGHQLLMDDQDEPVGEVVHTLITSCQLSLSDAVAHVRRLGGVPVPAHVNRSSNSLLSNLGFIPPGEAFTTLEITAGSKGDQFLEAHPELAAYRILRNSDAHQLIDLSERENAIDLRERTLDCLIDTLSIPLMKKE
ncbi:phosphoesterase [Acidaminobacter sp.]|uniref:phosphoesterase n=1 Tax=Acidaminobacter sp. TaxID=1872102 RepID=UPI0013833FBB|nr:phosphoesterase [Acidaminobacter sp.]MDK9710847.1 phosphoesterase [Acidaminobacter sp.]MZQ98310.1 phosphoesterase [Acidaminobacter sp.]